jgi:hypothetical protein
MPPLTAFRNRRQQFALWLALAAVFYRALIPVGFMPASAAQVRAGAVLVLCSGGLLQTAEPQAPGKAGMHAYTECGFAAAAAAPPPAVADAPRFAVASVPVISGALPVAPTLQLALPPVRGPPLFS